MRRCFRGCSTIAFTGGRGPQGTQFRQSFSHGDDSPDGRLRPRREALLGSAGRAGTDLSFHRRRTCGWRPRWRTGRKVSGRDAHQPQHARRSDGPSCIRAGARPLRETLEAIAQADLITLGPGSLFTSVIPNLLVEGIPQAIAASPAVKAYFVNLMSQPGETTGLRASDHVAALLRHAGDEREPAGPLRGQHAVRSCGRRWRTIARARPGRWRTMSSKLETMGVEGGGRPIWLRNRATDGYRTKSATIRGAHRRRRHRARATRATG